MCTRMKSEKTLLVVACCIIGWAIPALSHTAAESNAVVRSMLSMADHFWISLLHLDDSVLNWPATPETWNGFLQLGINKGWTLEEKNAAFDWYLESMSRQDIQALSPRNKDLLLTAVFQCEKHCHTNSYLSLERLAVNASGRLREDAMRTAIACAPLDDALLSFTENVATNSVVFELKERYFGLAKLRDKFGMVPVNADMTNKVIGLYYRLRNDGYISICCDGVLTNRLDGYAMSSNRLDVARNMLSLTNIHPRVIAYYVGVTNELISSGQPLRRINVGGNE